MFKCYKFFFGNRLRTGTSMTVLVFLITAHLPLDFVNRGVDSVRHCFFKGITLVTGPYLETVFMLQITLLSLLWIYNRAKKMKSKEKVEGDL